MDLEWPHPYIVFTMVLCGFSPKRGSPNIKVVGLPIMTNPINTCQLFVKKSTTFWILKMPKFQILKILVCFESTSGTMKKRKVTVNQVRQCLCLPWIPEAPRKTEKRDLCFREASSWFMHPIRCQYPDSGIFCDW